MRVARSESSAAQAVALALGVVVAAVFAGMLASPPPVGAQTLLTPELKLQMAGVGGPPVSPDGARVAYTVSEYDATEARRTTRIWLLEPDSGRTRAVTQGDADGSPAWAPT